MNQRICTVEDCERSLRAQELCKFHYDRQRIRGTFGFVERIRAVVGKGLELIVTGVVGLGGLILMGLLVWWAIRVGYFGDGNTGAFDQ